MTGVWSEAEALMRGETGAPKVIRDYYNHLNDLIKTEEGQASALRGRADELRARVELLERVQARIESGDEALADFIHALPRELDDDTADQIADWCAAHPVDLHDGTVGDGKAPPVLLTAAGKSFLTDETLRYPRGRDISAGELPSLRDHLTKMWHADIFERLGDSRPESIAWERDTLAHASLWWIAADMVDVLIAASRSIPDDVLATDIEPLDRCGLVVCERPWTGTPSRLVGPDNEIAVDAFLWGPIKVDGPNDVRPDTSAIAVSSYQFTTPGGIGPDPGSPHDLRALAIESADLGHNGRFWYPLGRSDWPLGDRLNDPPWPMDDQTLSSFAEDRRVLCALNTLLAHGGIATTTMRQVTRGERRRAERAGDLRDRSYRIVTLRELRTPGDPTTPDGHKVAHDHRWLVSGHWRRQPYGPGRELRRLQWINPFVKGPEDKPLRPTEVVKAWRR